MHERGLARPRDDGAAVLQAAVVGQDDVQQRPRKVTREVGDRLDLAANAVVAERDLALELARVGQVRASVIPGVGLELADVVQQRAADGEVAIDVPENDGGCADELGDADRVLEQAAPVGMVVVLRRGRLAVGLTGRRRGVEQRGEQP